MSSEVAAEFQGVTKEYPAGLLGRRRLRAVEGVSFRLGAGEVLGLVGPNRAGKTTLVKLLLSLCRPGAGRVSRFGNPAEDRRTLGRVGYVHENPAFPRHVCARTLLAYCGALGGVSGALLRRRIPELLDRVGLADRAHEPIARFSKGMIQRVSLAQALLNDPDLLVLDEPNEGLDLTGRRLAAELIRDLRRRGGSVLMVTHNPSDVEELCDRIVVLVGGRVVHQGSVGPTAQFRRNGLPERLDQQLLELYGATGS